MSRADRAEELFRKGYNCSQAVILSFCDLLGVDFDTLAKASVCYGGGTGRMRLTCGSVNAMFMALGLLYSTSDGSASNKNEMYARVQEVAKRFREKNGSINCAELLTGKGIEAETSPTSEARTEGYYKKRPCIGCIRDAVEILEEYLAEHPLA